MYYLKICWVTFVVKIIIDSFHCAVDRTFPCSYFIGTLYRRAGRSGQDLLQEIQTILTMTDGKERVELTSWDMSLGCVESKVVNESSVGVSHVLVK